MTGTRAAKLKWASVVVGYLILTVALAIIFNTWEITRTYSTRNWMIQSSMAILMMAYPTAYIWLIVRFWRTR